MAPESDYRFNRFPEANAPQRVAIRDLYQPNIGYRVQLLPVKIPDNQALKRFGFREAGWC
jgi:hypothetical protein